jgi:hypothetical protein
MHQQQQQQQQLQQQLIWYYDLNVAWYLTALIFQHMIVSGSHLANKEQENYYRKLVSLVDENTTQHHPPTLAWVTIRILPTLLFWNNQAKYAVSWLQSYRKIVAKAGVDTLPQQLLKILTIYVEAYHDLVCAPDGGSEVYEKKLLASTERVVELINYLDNRNRGVRLAEESADGITLQLEVFLTHAGCNLDYINLILTAHLLAFSNEENHFPIIQNNYVKRVNNIANFAANIDHHGVAINLVLTLISYQRAWKINPRFPAGMVKASIAENFVYKPYLLVEMMYKLGLNQAVQIFQENAVFFAMISPNPVVMEKYRSFQSDYMSSLSAAPSNKA